MASPRRILKRASKMPSMIFFVTGAATDVSLCCICLTSSSVGLGFLRRGPICS